MTSPKIGIALLALSLALVFPEPAKAQDALPWFNTYTIPGNYVVGGVDAAPLGFDGGVRTQRLRVGGVPANADILAAFLYWETIWSGPPNVLDGLRDQVRFRGEAVTGVQSSSKALNGVYAACGPGETMTMMRADVLRLLPLQLDENGAPTGRRVVNDTDLTANGLDPHSVGLPDSGLTFAPKSAGASLVVIYQDPNPLAPLRSVVVYDGIHIQAPGATTTQRIRGFLESTGNQAKLTHIGGTGGGNVTDSIWFTGSGAQRLVGLDEFNKPAGSSLDRGWSNPTFQTVSSYMPGTNTPPYGEQVSTKVDHYGNSPYDCLSWAAIVFSTTVKDTDGDGLVNRLEDVSGLKNPAGIPLPDIHGMGATSAQRDLFVEIGAMRAPAGTTYRVAKEPFVGTITDEDGHNHLPSPLVLKKVGDAFATPPAGHLPIAVHFDVGPIADYRLLGPEYLSTAADSYIVGVLHPSLARGGEQIVETESERFPGFSGVVSWPAGYQFLALAPVGAQGEELLDPDAAGWCANPAVEASCRRRFDLNRQGIFHYMLFAHARGVPKSEFPCLNAMQEPVPYPVGMTCGALAANDAYDVPKSVSGIAELPGRYSLVSLGLWDDFVGSTDMQANTALHEIGHNLNLWHGGAPPTFTNTSSGLHIFVPPNCRPNHLSVMSYLFQATGIRNAAGLAETRLSAEVNGPIDEQDLADGPLGLNPNAPYTSWYAPKQTDTLGDLYKLEVATKHCDGTPLGPDDPVEGTVRLDATSPDEPIDWAGNGGAAQYVGGQDVNFDGKKEGEAALLAGYNDWDGILLNRVGTGHDMAGLSLGSGLDFGGLDFGGLDFGGLDFGGLDFGGLDFGGLDFGGLDFGGLDFGGLDFGGLDFGGLDFGGLDFGGLESEVESELTYEIVLASIAPGGSTGPNALKAFVRGTDGAGGINSSVPGGDVWVPPGEPTNCSSLTPAQCHRIRLDWEPPSVGGASVDFYTAQRVWVPAGVNVPAPGSVVVNVGSTPDGATRTLVDGEDLPNAQRFIYWVRGSVEGDLGNLSNFAILPARNAAPVALGETAVTDEDQSVVISVLDNDTDGDTSSHDTLRVVSIPSMQGGFAEIFDEGRKVRFTPDPNLNSANTGVFSFTYQADDGVWSRDASLAMSDPSNEVTVTITVNPVNDVPIAYSQGVTTNEDTALPIALSASDVETPAGALSFTMTAPPAHGTLSGSWPNFTYAPHGNYNGNDSFKFKVTDRGDPDLCAGGAPACSAARASDEATVSITIYPVNDDPEATALSGITTNVNTAKVITLKGKDLETCDLTFTIVSGPSHGTLGAITNNGCASGTPKTDSASVTYTPASGYVGADSFKYTVTDRGDPHNCAGGAPACSAVIVSPQANVAITVISPATSLTFVRADVWLANDRSATTKFDVKADILKNGSVVATAILTQTTLGFGILSPIYKEITGLTGTVSYGTTDTLSLKISVKLSTALPGTTTVKVWYNHPSPPGNTGHIHAKIGTTAVKYYMIKTSAGALGLKKGSAPGPTQYIQWPVTTSYKTFGTWSITGP